MRNCMPKKTVNPKVSDRGSSSSTSKPLSAPKESSTVSALNNFIDSKYTAWLLAALLVLIVSAVYFPVAFGGKYPLAHDITQWEGGARKIIEYNNENSDRALWTQNMFSGMPAYMISFPNRFPYLESVTKLTDKLINWRIFLLIVGGLGIFVLLKLLKMDSWLAFFGAIAFVFSCHWVGLVEIGHNTKFRAIMYIPWVIWTLLYLRKNPGILGLGMMATFLITQLRENHPQITYYLYLFIGMYWIYNLIEAVQCKTLKRFGIFTMLLILAFGLTALAVMNPYLSTMEYSHYTMRGGSSGLDTAYAQGWSFHPWEILGLIIPDFFGGITTEAIPGMPQGLGPYWGWMEFTQIYNYFGIIVLFFGCFALFGKHKSMARFLWISSAIFTIMSFGKFAPALSDLLLKYLPFFNKFRVPSMILTMVQINAVLLAAMGLDTIIQKQQEQDARFAKLLYRSFWISGAVFVAYSLFAKRVFTALPLATAREVQMFTEAGYTGMLEQLRDFRLLKLVRSGIISLLFLTSALGVAYLFSAKRIKQTVFIFIISLLCFVDLWIYTGKYLKELRPVQQHREHFSEKDYDSFLLKDKDNYRIYPSEVGPAGDWAFYHQTVDGYSAAKLKRYDDFLRTSLHPQFKRFREILKQYNVEVPLPVHDMLSTRYIITRDSLPSGAALRNLSLAYRSPFYPIYIYQNDAALPRAWFVESTQTVTPADSILSLMNDLDFDPQRIAYLESPIEGLQSPLEASVIQTQAEMHSLKYKVKNQSQSLLVLSEIYYPAGWKAYLNQTEIPIYPVNYILRGLVIPAGDHELELVFDPPSYRQSIRYSAIGLLMTLLCLAAGIYIYQRKKKISEE